MSRHTKTNSAFNQVPDIGVIWVMDEAIKLGFYNGNPEWANLGQGEPEVGPMKGAPPRITHFDIEPGDDRYGPLNGMHELRTAIANHYNRLYRTDRPSKYTADNVSLAMGGRLALSRIFSILGTIRLGYKVPEYPAYEELINYQLDRVLPVLVPSSKENNYSIPPANFAEAIEQFQLDAFIFSNPCNPTGHVIKEEDLKSYVETARSQNCAIIIDEVYSHFIYENGQAALGPVSAAQFIHDVDADQVLIVDGLTKSFRYPGWRLAWTLGPIDIIADLGRAASGIDGGPSMPIQRAALNILEPGNADQETTALRQVFSHKQAFAIKTLQEMGITCSGDTSSTFYIWADISQLQPPLNNADDFFREALKNKVMVVPGHMFDIDPGTEKRELGFNQYVRISFGPEEENLKKGLARLAFMIKKNSIGESALNE